MRQFTNQRSLFYFKKKLNEKIKLAFLVLILFITNSIVQAQPTYVWGKQLMLAENGVAVAIVSDEDNNIILTGSLSSNLFGTTLGGDDAYIVKYDSTGKIIWQDQFGSNQQEQAKAIAADTLENYYVTGFTKGRISGQSFGNSDIFLYKYDKNGNQLKAKSFGTSGNDSPESIHVDDSANIYICGFTSGNLKGTNKGANDCFIMKLDSAFNEIFTLQFGTDVEDRCYDVFTDKNYNIYLSGFTEGKLGTESYGGYDAFIAKYSLGGEQIWINQIGTSEYDNATNVRVDNENNIYVSGIAAGVLAGEHQGSADVFLIKYDSENNIIWEKQIGSHKSDALWAMHFVPGKNQLVLSGSMEFQNFRQFAQVIDFDGNVLWSTYFGSTHKQFGTDNRNVCITNNGNLYLCGFAWENDIFGVNNSNGSAILARYKPEVAPKTPLAILNKINDTIFNTDTSNVFKIPSKHISSQIENETFEYEAKRKGTVEPTNWISPNGNTLVFDGSPDIYSIFDDTTYHKVVLQGNSKLPSWLTFDPVTLEFSGTPTRADELEIIVIAKSSTKHIITDEFTLTVEEKPSSAIDHNLKGVLVYPNPASEAINIEGQFLNDTNYQIINMTGGIVQQGILSGKSIDVSELTGGSYLLTLSNNDVQLSRKVVIQ